MPRADDPISDGLIDTRQVSKADRQTFWLETVCQQILPVKIDTTNDVHLQAAMSCLRVGSLSMRAVVGGKHIYVRDEQHVRRHDPESFQVGIPTRGNSLLVQDGREATLQPGNIVMWDSSRPYTLVMEDRFLWNVFLFPKDKLRRSNADLRRLTAIPIKAETGVSAVVAGFLIDLIRHARQLGNEPDSQALGETAGDLIGALVQSQFGLPWSVASPQVVIRERARHFIGLNHGNSRVDPSLVADAIGVSVRSLHQAFRDEGSTVMDTLRHHRLAAIRRDLADPRLTGRTVGRIASSHGMPNSTVFSRVFKIEFGTTPREFRANASGSPGF